MLTRRRFIAISAAGAGLPALPILSRATTERPSSLHGWHGVALGADAMLQINHPDGALAQRLIARSLAEVHRLEQVFSLYRADSALRQLNAAGRLADPPQDLVRILAESAAYSRLTGGAFDVTVQPLWDLYADHFARDFTDPLGPAPDAIATALARVGHAAVTVDARSVGFDRPAMAITLNGIAQGYITDRVAELLLAAGLDQALIDMGETRALGGRPSGGPWLVGLEDPRAPDRVLATLPLRDRAVATSGGYGTPFDAAGRFNHLFDPQSGRTGDRYLSVTVLAATATMADALSTGFSLMGLDATLPIVRQCGASAHFVLPDGSRQVQA